jgi:hypothetical protein
MVFAAKVQVYIVTVLELVDQDPDIAKDLASYEEVPVLFKKLVRISY